MKKTKRKIAVFLAVMILVTSVSFTGCGSRQDNISLGQWLMLVNQTFGMESYQNEEPYFDNIEAGTFYFDTVQTAAEWEVIDREQTIDVDELLTWGEALVTLVNAGGFLPVDSSEDEKIEYAIEHFDNSIRTYWMKRDITVDKAVYLLGIAHEQWAGATYDHIIEEAVYREEVVDLTGEEVGLDYYIVEENRVKIPVDEAVELEAGDVYVLPGINGNPAVQTYKAEKVYRDDEYIYVENSSDEIELEDVVESLFVEETYMPDMDRAIVYDGNGNILSVGSDLVSMAYEGEKEGIRMARLEAGAAQGGSMVRLADQTVKKDVKIGNVTVTYEFSRSGKFHFKASAKTDNLLESKSTKLELTASAEITDLEVTNKIDFNIFEGLKSAVLKIDYGTKISGGIERSDQIWDKVYAPYDNRNSKFWTNLKGSSFKERSEKGAKTIKIASVDIFSVGIARVCLDIGMKFNANGSFTLTITESGTKGLEYSHNNLRVINESRKDTEAQLKGGIELTASIGPALYAIGLKKQIIGAQIQIGVGAAGNVKAHLADPDNHLIDETDFGDEAPEAFSVCTGAEIPVSGAILAAVAEGQGGVYEGSQAEEIQLHCDICVDITGYFILNLGLDENSMANKLVSGKIKTKWEIFGKENARLLELHVDNWDWGTAFQNIAIGMGAVHPACTLAYVPFGKKEAEEMKDGKEAEADGKNPEESQNGQQGSTEREVEAKGDMIILGSMMISVPVNEKRSILIERIPEGYALDDLWYESANESVAKVDGKGTLTGMKEGSVIITIGTNDGKYKTYCAVIVTTDEVVEFTPMKI